MEIAFQVNTQATFEASKGKRKAADAAGDCRHTKKPKSGRPAKPIRKISLPRKTPTKLRKDRPVQAILPMDIWESILSFCTLDRLLKLRGVCSTFHAALAGDLVWKNARHKQFGPGHPEPPSGLTEMQYADLLVGVGCQARGCQAKDTRRTYWGFRRRWCEVCLVRCLSRGRKAKQDLLMYDLACRCIPQAKYDSWGHYQWVGHQDEAYTWVPLFPSHSVAYSEFDIRAMNRRILDFLSTYRTTDELNTWFEKQEAANLVHVKQLRKVEQWVEEDRKSRDKERADIRERRADFFKQCASQLDPPLDADVLGLCPSFDRSVRISKIPSRQSWQKLLPKIADERAHAEAVSKQKKRRHYHQAYRIFLKDNCTDTIERRKHFDCPEQCIVLDLAEQAVNSVLTDPKGVHESDLVNIILRGVYDAYQRLDDGLKHKTPHGPYRLIMDDARLVYNRRILPTIERIYVADTKALARQLKCPGNSCRRAVGTYEFEELMQHIHHEHRYDNAFQHLLISDHFENEWWQFPWYCIEWPRNIPMLATHQKAPHKWDIDDDTPYVRAEPDQTFTKQESIDAFTSIALPRTISQAQPSQVPYHMLLDASKASVSADATKQW